MSDIGHVVNQVSDSRHIGCWWSDNRHAQCRMSDTGHVICRLSVSKHVIVGGQLLDMRNVRLPILDCQISDARQRQQYLKLSFLICEK